MKKRLLFRVLLGVFLLAGVLSVTSYKSYAADVVINEENFPDEMFRAYLTYTFYAECEDGILMENEIDSITHIVLPDGYNFKSLNGIKLFRKLKYLDCHGKHIGSLDLGGMTNLEELFCFDCNLTELNLSGLEKLYTLSCSENKLTTLDIHGLTQLNTVNCEKNDLKKLNANGCINLRKLTFDKDDPVDLDLGNCPQLAVLNYPGYAIRSINLSGTYVTELYFPNCSNLTSINLSGCGSLSVLNCSYCNLSALDISSCIVLRDLQCTNNQITTLDISKNELLREAYYLGDISGLSYVLPLRNLSVDKKVQLQYKPEFWYKKNGKKYCYYERKKFYNNGIQKVGDETYYFSLIDGSMQYGWKRYNDDWYYFDPGSGTMKKGWLKMVKGIKFIWYYLDPSTGVMAIGLKKIGNSIDCFNGNGELVKENIKDGWSFIEGKWYLVENDNIVTGWKELKNKWYYLDPKTGAMLTGWGSIDGKWYYFNANGAMVTGWIRLNKKWYYLDPKSGIMATGWRKLGSVWYYFKNSGAMATGWAKIGAKWYFFKQSGAMCIGWVQDGKDWYYLDKNGAMVTGWVWIDKKRHFFRNSGRWDKDTSKYGASYADVSTPRGAGFFSQWYESDGLYSDGIYPEGQDTLYFDEDGTFHGSFIGADGTGCKYSGRFSELKMVDGQFYDGGGANVTFVATLTEFYPSYSNGTRYWVETGKTKKGSTGKYVYAVDHPVFKVGKTYYFNIIHNPGSGVSGAGAGSKYEIWDSNKKPTGYWDASGAF